jgi:uncharacterized coiled-coil protein SlyX
MRKVERWIFQIGEVIVGLVIGLVIWLITDRKPDTLVAPLIMGVLLALVFEVFRTYYWLEEKLNDVDTRLADLEERLGPRESPLKALARTLQNKVIEGDNLPKAWMRLLLVTVKKYRGSNFQPPKEMYSHKDREWLERLQTMLKPLVRKKLAVWDDTKIEAGAKWKDKIQGALAAAKVAVLLVSPNFLGSDFIAEHELPPLLEAAEKEGLLILWVYLSSCLYDETEIGDYQAAHNISRPLDSLTPAEQGSVLTQVCRQIKAATNPQ